MTCYLITQEELDRLYEKPWTAQMIYFRGLRPYMDYTTGIVGIRRGVSRQSIAEELAVPAEQGRHRSDTITPSAKAIRHGLEVLKECGLIEQIAIGKKLVFRLPHAHQDNSVQNMRGRTGAEMMDRVDDISKANDNRVVRSSGEPVRGREKIDMRGLHPVSGRNIEKLNSDTEAATTASKGKCSAVRQGELLPAAVVTSVSGGRQEERPASSPSSQRSPVAKPGTLRLSTASVWAAYREGYVERYGVEPLRNPTVNGQLAHLLRRLGQEAPAVARYYLDLETPLYRREGHSVGMLLKHAEHLRTLWKQAGQTRGTDSDRPRTTEWEYATLENCVVAL